MANNGYHGSLANRRNLPAHYVHRPDPAGQRLPSPSMSGVADCDGPLAIMILIAPSLIVYAGGAAYYAMVLKGQKRSALVFLCVLMVLAAGAKTWTVFREQLSAEHQSDCGEN